MGQIKVKKNVGGIEGLCIIEPTLHGDSRGYFMETYNKNDMAEAGLTMEFVQDNQSASTKGVLRGLHFQKQHPQGKLCLLYTSFVKRKQKNTISGRKFLLIVLFLSNYI